MKNTLFIISLCLCLLIDPMSGQMTFTNLYTNDKSSVKVIPSSNGITVSLSLAQSGYAWILSDVLTITPTDTFYYITPKTLSGKVYFGLNQGPDSTSCLYPSGYCVSTNPASLALSEGACKTGFLPLYSPTDLYTTANPRFTATATYGYEFVLKTPASGTDYDIKITDMVSPGVLNSGTQSDYATSSQLSFGFEALDTGSAATFCIQTSVEYSSNAGECGTAKCSTDHCATCDGTGCTACQAGYYLSGDSATCGLVENCESYDGSGDCNSCTVTSGKHLSVDKSYCGSTEGCQTYSIGTFCSPTAATCQCPALTYLSGDSKYCGSVVDCQTYDANGVCQSCTTASGKFISGDKNHCGTVASCQTYDASGLCTTCTTASGFYPNSAGTYCGSVQDCDTYDASGVCQGCTTASTKILSGDNNHCGSVRVCQTYNSAGACQSCTTASGLYASGDGTYCGNVEKCQAYDGTGACQSCIGGYTLNAAADTCEVLPTTSASKSSKKLTAGQKVLISVLTISSGLILTGILVKVYLNHRRTKIIQSTNNAKIGIVLDQTEPPLISPEPAADIALNKPEIVVDSNQGASEVNAGVDS